MAVLKMMVSCWVFMLYSKSWFEHFSWRNVLVVQRTLYFLPITSASTCMNSVTLKVEAVHYCEMLDETFTVWPEDQKMAVTNCPLVMLLFCYSHYHLPWMFTHLRTIIICRHWDLCVLSLTPYFWVFQFHLSCAAIDVFMSSMCQAKLSFLNFFNILFQFDVGRSMHHHTIQIN